MTLVANIFLLVGLLSIGYCAYKIIEIQYEIKELNRQSKRNHEVYNLRMDILNYHFELFEKLPEYETMVESEEPLEMQYWINKLRS